MLHFIWTKKTETYLNYLRMVMVLLLSCVWLLWVHGRSLPGSSVHGIVQARIWSGLQFPSPGDLPDPGIEPRSPALQADSLPTEQWWASPQLWSQSYSFACIMYFPYYSYLKIIFLRKSKEKAIKQLYFSFRLLILHPFPNCGPLTL